MIDTVADVDRRVALLRDAFRELTRPYVSRGQREVPRYELTTCQMDDGAVQVRVRVWKPKDQHVVLAEFSPGAAAQLRDRLCASGLSWEAYFEQAVHSG